MMTIEPPREMAGSAGKMDDGTDAEVWRAAGLSRSGLSRFLRTAQEAVGLRGEVEVLLASDRTLRRLNRTFRGKDKATDVLSFPASKEFAGEHGGDLAISLHTAQRQADAFGHSLRDEVRVLLVHGLLHLSGMDHEVDGGEMAAREGVLREALKLPDGLIARVEGRGAVKARAKAKANTGVLRFAQDDGEKRATTTTTTKTKTKTKTKAKARASARASARARAKAKAKAKAKADSSAVWRKDKSNRGRGVKVGA